MQKKYLIIALGVIVIIVIGIAIVLTSSQPMSDDAVLRQSGQDLSNQDSEVASTTGIVAENSSGESLSAVQLSSRSIRFPDIDIIRYQGLNTLYLASTRTGTIFSTQLGDSIDSSTGITIIDVVQEEILQLPESNLEYIFLPSEQHIQKFVIYKKDGMFFRYDVSNDRVTQLPEDISYAHIDTHSNRLYYITNTTPTEIRSINITTNQVTTHVTRTGIEWFSVSSGSILYRTDTTLYRHSLKESVDRLIEQGATSVSASVSSFLPRALLEVDGEILLYDFTDDTVQPLNGFWNPRTFVWQRNGLEGHTIQNGVYKILNLRQEPSISEFSGDIESLQGFDQQHMFVAEDGTFMIWDRVRSSLVLYLASDRVSTSTNSVSGF